MSKKSKEKHKTTSCGAVTWSVVDGELSILLIKQFSHRDWWGMPKGRIEPGETYESCALREVKEETGIDVRLGVRLPDCEARVGKKGHKLVVSYLATPVGGKEVNMSDPDNEVAEAKWHSIKALPELHPYQKTAIIAAVARIASYERLNNHSSKKEDLEIDHCSQVLLEYREVIDEWH